MGLRVQGDSASDLDRRREVLPSSMLLMCPHVCVCALILMCSLMCSHVCVCALILMSSHVCVVSCVCSDRRRQPS